MIDLRDYDYFSFDCFGTLIDWETGILHALEPLLRKHDQDLEDEEILKLYGSIESRVQKEGYMSYRAVLRSVVMEFAAELGFGLDAGDELVLADSVA